MNENSVPDAAVQIAAAAIPDLALPQRIARDTVAALARAGWLHDPAEVAALSAVVDAAPDVLAQLDAYARMKVTSRRLQRALDALPPTGGAR